MKPTMTMIIASLSLSSLSHFVGWTDKQCMVVEMSQLYCLVISSKRNKDYNECNLNLYMIIIWFMNNNLARALLHNYTINWYFLPRNTTHPSLKLFGLY